MFEKRQIPISQKLQVGAMEWRQMTRIHIALHQFLDASQPLAHRPSTPQRGGRVIGDNAPGLGRMLMRQVVGAAGQFFTRLRL